jgi:hypothetical protein
MLEEGTVVMKHFGCLKINVLNNFMRLYCFGIAVLDGFITVSQLKL